MRKLKVDTVDLNQVFNLNKEQAKSRYNIGDTKLRMMAEDAGAIVRVGEKVLYSRTRMDKYFENMAE